MERERDKGEETDGRDGRAVEKTEGCREERGP
jgi:hypothetical protein